MDLVLELDTSLDWIGKVIDGIRLFFGVILFLVLIPLIFFMVWATLKVEGNV